MRQYRIVDKNDNVLVEVTSYGIVVSDVLKQIAPACAEGAKVQVDHNAKWTDLLCPAR